MLSPGFTFKIQRILIIFLFCLGCSVVNQNESQTCSEHGMISFTYINIPCKECIYLIQDILDSNKSIFNYDITDNTVHDQIYVLLNYCYNHATTSPNIIEQDLIDNGFIINENLSRQKQIVLQDRCCNI